MLTQADNDFLTLEREQKALFRAQAQIPSDISETSSQPAMVEDEDEEIEEIHQDDGSQLEIQEIEVSEAELNHLPFEKESEIMIEIEKIQEETSTIAVTPQQNQEQALELLKSAFEQIKLALSLLNDAPKAGSQNLRQELEIISKTLVPIAEEPVAQLAAEPVVEVAAEPVAQLAAEPVAQLAAEPVAQLAAEPVIEVAKEPVVPKLPETFAAKVAKNATSKVTKVVVPKATKVVVSKKAEVVAPKAAEVAVPKEAEVVVSKAQTEEEFKVVMPKKSKNTSAIIIVPKVEVPEQNDEFPSLVRTISPVQKSGFWSSGKNSLEIAKSIAQIPSPPPTRSSPLIKTVKSRESSRGGSRGAIDEENEYSDDEFRTRKAGNYEDEDDYWQ
jgi:hypothetical protein